MGEWVFIENPITNQKSAPPSVSNSKPTESTGQKVEKFIDKNCIIA